MVLSKLDTLNLLLKKTLVDSFKTRNDEKGSGSISTFKAMMVTLAGNVGGGNVVGVATAVAAGGMGAVFWMWIAAFFWNGFKIWGNSSISIISW